MCVCVCVLSEAAILYRIPFTWSQRKQHWKLVHASLLLSSLFLSILGLCAVFDFHTGYHIPNLYSLHSWVGICTVVLFTVQVGGGDVEQGPGFFPWPMWTDQGKLWALSNSEFFMFRSYDPNKKNIHVPVLKVEIAHWATFLPQAHLMQPILLNPFPSLLIGQWVLGLVGFLSPCSPLGFRKLLKPVHAWMGMAIFILSLASSLSGINEKLLLALWVTKNADPPPISTNYIGPTISTMIFCIKAYVTLKSFRLHEIFTIMDKLKNFTFYRTKLGLTTYKSLKAISL